MTGSDRTGGKAEALARRYLEQQGMRTLERNFRSRFGEIDLVMRDGDALVFVEVRYRRSTAFGGPLASVDKRKQQRLHAAAQLFVQQHARYARDPMRFDVVGITGEDNTVEWLADAFAGPA